MGQLSVDDFVPLTNIVVLSPETIEFLGKKDVDVIPKLKKLALNEGQMWIKLNRPTWPDWVVADMLRLCKQHNDIFAVKQIDTATKHRIRQKFCVAAWMLGASWASIGALFGVRRESIMSSVNKILPASIRATTKRYSNISFARLEEIYIGYNRLIEATSVDDVLRLDYAILITLIDGAAPEPDVLGSGTLSEGTQSRIPSVTE